MIGNLEIEGYIRGKPLSANDLVHIPGLDSFQISAIYSKTDPHSMNSKGKPDFSVTTEETSNVELLEEPDPAFQDSLESTNEMDDSQVCGHCLSKFAIAIF